MPDVESEKNAAVDELLKSNAKYEKGNVYYLILGIRNWQYSDIDFLPPLYKQYSCREGNTSNKCSI